MKGCVKGMVCDVRGRFLDCKEGKNGYYDVIILQKDRTEKISTKDAENIQFVKSLEPMAPILFQDVRVFPRLYNGSVFDSFSCNGKISDDC